MKEQNTQAKLNLRGRLRQAGVKTTKYIQTKNT